MQSFSDLETFNTAFDVYPSVGAGDFGYWDKDEYGMPCYHLNTKKQIEQNVWHLVGNEHITATAHAKGYVQIYAWDRGPQILNYYDPENDMKAGGYTLIFSDKIKVGTYFNNDSNTDYNITWGCGYVRKKVENSLLYVEETIFAPDSRDSVLIHNLKVKNISGETQHLFIIPIWEPNWLPIDPGLIMTPPYDKFWNILRKKRGRKIQNSSKCLIEKDVLTLQFPQGKQTKKRNSWRVMPVANFFLCSLNMTTPKYYFSNKNELKQFISLYNTEEKIFSPKGKTLSCNLLCFVEQRSLVAGEEINLRYQVGYGYMEELVKYKMKYMDKKGMEERKKYITVKIPDIKVPLDRELRWHSYYLQAGCMYSEYFRRYFVDQGSAYGFVHGASGAPRDWAFFIVPLIYLRPDLAREMLLFLCQLQDDKTGKFPYALVGNGKTTGAGVHSWSSDLDLFFLWAVSEYLGATFDVAILHEEIPFRNMPSPKTVTFLHHIEKAFYHLTKKVGVGKHGLIRSGTGDWNDVFLAFSPFPPITMLRGESVFNSAMSVLVLPEIARWIETYNSPLSKQMNDFAENQRQLLRVLWNGKWFPRGYIGIGERKLGEDNLFLDVQPFAILADLLEKEQQRRLISTIKEKCVDTQSFGATCLVPPMKGKFLEPGSDTNGGVWYAINAWLTWAWSKYNSHEAWEFLLKNTLFAHAEDYPHIWYGIWSGPDAYNSAEHPRAGETFCLNFTPMTEFPIMNMNCHASVLFAVLKIFGLSPKNKTLFIDPKVPFGEFSLITPLISFSYQPDEIKLKYTPVCSGGIRLSIKLSKNISSLIEKLKVVLNNETFSQFHINEENFLTLTTTLERNKDFSLLITIL